MAAFLTLIAATIAAFFITQHLKVTTPLITGVSGPTPAVIDPLSRHTCQDAAIHEQLSGRATRVSFYLLHRSDAIDVYVVNSSGARVATLARNRFMRRSRKVPTPFTWNGREQNRTVAPAGRYYFRVYLIHQQRTVTISNESGPLPVRVTTRAACP